MTTYHVDPVNGNDSNNGLSWNTPFKTISHSTIDNTVYRSNNFYAPGDLVKITKSPDPVSIGDAAWEYGSRFVTTSEVLVKRLDYGYSGTQFTWVPSTNVVRLFDYGKVGIYQQGFPSWDYSTKFNIQSTFTTGKIAYQTIYWDEVLYGDPPFDYSMYSKISFWIKTSLAISVNVLKVCLCSDVTGNVIVDEFVIPAIRSEIVNRWFTMTLDKGSALGSAIQSVAIYAISDPGSFTLHTCGMIACNDLSLTSLIAKGSNLIDGTDGWYSIGGIIKNTIGLCNYTQQEYVNYTAGTFASSKYKGTTELSNTYIREPIPVSTLEDLYLRTPGEADNFIEFCGGYNPVTDEQDGETFFDFQVGLGMGFHLDRIACLSIKNISVVRAYVGFRIISSSFISLKINCITGCTYAGLTCITNDPNISSYGGNGETWYYASILPEREQPSAEYLNANNLINAQIGAIVNNYAFNIELGGDYWFSSGVMVKSYFDIGQIAGSVGCDASNPLVDNSSIPQYYQSDLTLGDVSDSVIKGKFIADLVVCNVGNVSMKVDEIEFIQFGIQETEITRIRNFMIQDAIILGFNVQKSFVFIDRFGLAFYNCSIDDLYFEYDWIFSSSKINSIVFEKINNDPQLSRIVYEKGYIVESQKDIRHTSKGIAWRFYYIPTIEQPTYVIVDRGSDIRLCLARLAVLKNQRIIVSAWFLRKDLLSSGYLTCKNTKLFEFNSNIKSPFMSVGVDIWEKLSITLQPIETGIIEIEAVSFVQNSDYVFYLSENDLSVYVDDFSVEDG